MLASNRIALSLAGLLLAVSHAQADGPIESGQEIAMRWCSACHLVAADQEAASGGAPTFQSIASRYGDETEYLAGFLADPHPAMPNLSLTRQEIKDLLAYISSLQ